MIIVKTGLHGERAEVVPECLFDRSIEQQIPMLSDRCKDVMIKDIESQRNYGDECDREDWMRLLEGLKEQE